MNNVLNIYDIFQSSKGWVLSGTNAKFDNLDLEQIKKKIGTKIIIKSSHRSLIADVLDVDFANSLLNKKNIFILIAGNEIEKLKSDTHLEIFRI